MTKTNYFEVALGMSITIDGREILIEESLGQRGNARTFKGEDARDTRPPLLIRQVFSGSPKLGQRWVDIRKHAVESKIPHVITYSAAGIAMHGGRTARGYFLVRPYADATLRDDPQRIYNGDMAVKALRDVTRGLVELHKRGMIHGELRPSNILVTQTGFAVADFESPATIDRSDGSRIAFDAPELLTGSSSPSVASDIYSLGKLARWLARPLEGADADYERKVLLRVASECLDIDPESRIDTGEVLALLSDKTSAPKFEALRFAALADMDARMEGILEAPQKQVRRAVQSAIRDLDGEHLQQTERIGHLLTADATHLLATMSFMHMHKSTRHLTRGHAKYIIQPKVNPEEDSFEFSPRDPYWDRVLELNSSPKVSTESLAIIRDVLGAETANEILSFEADSAEVAGRVAALRKELLTLDAYVMSEDVRGIMSNECPGVTVDEIRILRDAGYLLSVPFNGRNVYPMFQFDPRGIPFAEILDVNSRIGSRGMDAWSVIAWWLLPTRSAFGAAPADLLRTDRASVSELAARLADAS